MNARRAEFERSTAETRVVVALNLDGRGCTQLASGIGFLDHLLETLARHARFDLTLSCEGDLQVDDHHTAEDCGLVLGAAMDRALGERRGIARFGSALAPLDESLARSVVDCSGRPFAAVELELVRDSLGSLACENVSHMLVSFAIAARITLHVDVLRGVNDHHKAEAGFKATALALREAVAPSGFSDIPSIKDTLGAVRS
ncbi:MAG: imidazoleglycerol-phosphate dehydratase HisB [Gemmatimonadales bacterium]